MIFHCHGAEFQIFTIKHRKAVIRTLNKCDCIIALSKSWKLWFENTVHHKNVVVIKNVIAPPHINKKKNDKFVILFFGRLGKRKGIYDLLDVLSEHREEFLNKLEFLFGGDGDVEQVQAIIKEQNLNNIAKYQGWVSGIKKERLLNQADAYILPSYNEGLPTKKCILQKSRCRPLFRAASDFFIIQYAMYCDRIFRFSPKKPLHGRKSALQIIQPCRGNKFPIRSPDCTRHTVI